MTKKKKTEAPELALADFFCFSIYSTNLAFGRIYKPLLDEVGLTYPQFVAVVALYEENDQTVGGLGDKLYLDSSTLTPMLKRLEAMGYLTRKRDAADERQVRVRLTEKGRAVREKGFCGLSSIIEAMKLSPGDFCRMQGELCDLRDNLLKAVTADRG